MRLDAGSPCRTLSFAVVDARGLRTARRAPRRGGRCPSRALLGERDEQAVGELVVLAAQREAGVHALLLAAADDRVDIRVQAHGELADDRLLVQRADAVERGQRLAGVVRALQQQLAELDEAVAAQPAEVDDAAERVERLRGADVRRRLLAADVLLARLEREHEAAAPVDVGRLAGDAAGHAAQVGLVAAKNPNDGPPKSRRLPSVWPSPTATSTPHSPGGLTIPSGIGS